MNQSEDPKLQKLLKDSLSAYAIKQLGFDFVGDSSLAKSLHRVNPSGATAMRDSVIQGTLMMLKLYSSLAEAGLERDWHFVQITLTDGEDNSSKANLEEAAVIMKLVGETVPVQMLKNIFIGVDIDSSYQAKHEIGALVACGGENAEFFNINGSEIEDVFNKVKVQLGLLKTNELTGIVIDDMAAIHSQQKDYLVANVQEVNYVVMFNLDISYSMRGNKWNKVCKGVEKFMKQLGKSDLISCLVFNQDVQLLVGTPQAYKVPQTRRRLNSSIRKPRDIQQFQVYQDNDNERQKKAGKVLAFILSVVFIMYIIVMAQN